MAKFGARGEKSPESRLVSLPERSLDGRLLSPPESRLASQQPDSSEKSPAESRLVRSPQSRLVRRAESARNAFPLSFF